MHPCPRDTAQRVYSVFSKYGVFDDQKRKGMAIDSAAFDDFNAPQWAYLDELCEKTVDVSNECGFDTLPYRSYRFVGSFITYDTCMVRLRPSAWTLLRTYEWKDVPLADPSSVDAVLDAVARLFCLPH